jgi:hypothetical protein
VRGVFTAIALTALTGATVAVAQQTTQTQAQPPASTTQQEQYPKSTTAPSDPSAAPSSESSTADKQALMKKCMAQVQASNPGVPEKDVKQFCAKEVYRAPPQG